jgi:hypothetical protein
MAFSIRSVLKAFVPNHWALVPESRLQKPALRFIVVRLVGKHVSRFVWSIVWSVDELISSDSVFVKIL